jgi:hypothetical protein
MCAYVHAGRLVGSIASALVLVLMASAATPAPIETLDPRDKLNIWEALEVTG